MLGFLFDDEIVETDKFGRSDALILGVEEVLYGGGEMLREHLGDPLGFHGGGEVEKGERQASGGDLMNVCGDEE